MTNREIFDAVERREMTPEQGAAEMLAEDERLRSPFEQFCALVEQVASAFARVFC